MDVSVIQEDFVWKVNGEERKIPTLRSLTMKVRRRYVRDMSRYKTAREKYFASMGKGDPRMITIMSGIEAEMRTAIICAAKWETATPPIPAEIAPHESADFDRPRRAGQASRIHERLMDWIALQGEFESVEAEQRIAMDEVLNGVKPPKFKQFGIQAALAEMFERLREHLTDVYPATLRDGPAAIALFKQVTRKKANFFLHPMISPKTKLVGGNVWSETIRAEALETPRTEMNFAGIEKLIWKTSHNVIQALGNKADIENYFLKVSTNDVAEPPSTPGPRKGGRRGG